MATEAPMNIVSATLYEYGVDLISTLQTSFPDSEHFFMDVSKVFDPKYVFTVYFPLVFGLQWALGARLLGTLVVAEWLNMVLKWLMRGDRPYWWVLQVHHQVNTSNHHSLLLSSPPTAYNSSLSSTLPNLVQFSTTCETGPGTPSGHSMAMASVWYVLTHSAVEQAMRSTRLSSAAQHRLRLVLWSSFAALQLLVASSRLYIAAHFPHQCVLGVILGIWVARRVYDLTTGKWLHLTRAQWMVVAGTIPTTALATYASLLLSGMDPGWSIRNAYQWCAQPESIHIDTTPFYSMMRYSGTAFGLGLGLTSRLFAATDRQHFGAARTALTVLLGLALGAAAESAHAAIPKSNINLFYVLEFALNVALPYTVIAVAPYVVAAVSSAEAGRLTKAKSS